MNEPVLILAHCLLSPPSSPSVGACATGGSSVPSNVLIPSMPSNVIDGTPYIMVLLALLVMANLVCLVRRCGSRKSPKIENAVLVKKAKKADEQREEEEDELL